MGCSNSITGRHRQVIGHVIRLATIAAVITIGAHAQSVPKGFVVPACTISPQGHYGVTVPVLFAFPDDAEPKNSIIDLRSGKIVAPIETKTTGWTRHGPGGVLPSRWTPDESLLLWQVD